MLVLTRRVDEDILIGDNIVIRVGKIKGNRVTLGIEAPSDMRILRGEICNHEVDSHAGSDRQQRANAVPGQM